jgi:fructokinase
MEVAEAAGRGDPKAAAAIQRLEDRIARGFASLVNVIDPDVIVIGGGLSRLGSIYRNVPPLLERYGFGGGIHTPILAAKHGDSSGVRGAAWLWPSAPAKQ